MPSGFFRLIKEIFTTWNKVQNVYSVELSPVVNTLPNSPVCPARAYIINTKGMEISGTKSHVDDSRNIPPPFTPGSFYLLLQPSFEIWYLWKVLKKVGHSVLISFTILSSYVAIYSETTLSIWEESP